ncbi:hypothetical protein [Virgibacillus proomii]|uniref:hypothetical protein n=1 Tax=Virgibacillus proomii TaxID=84407 RepID=UPI001C12644E|nr:hypothetical protein [Virgibacillus proomii]MBU5266233.1 hypothetical protein [Virgibacillus proomii]
MANSYAEMNVKELLELNEKVTKYIAYKAYEAGAKGDEGIGELFSEWNSEERAVEKRSIFDQWDEEGEKIDYDTQFKRIQQAERDRIVAEAKANIQELTRYEYAQTLQGRKGISLGALVVREEFVINKEKRTVVCLLKGADYSKVYARGIAKCAPSDCFNVHIGMAIALRRALGLFVPAEYLNAPQPTEVRVGDKIRLKLRSRFLNGNIETVSGFYRENKPLTLESPGHIYEDQYEIIDDSDSTPPEEEDE